MASIFRLPYFEAFLSEVTRISSLVPLGVPHVASQDTQLDGYIIPKVMSKTKPV